MRISVFGLGYVGCVTGACLARMGHEVCGVDISAAKVDSINQGHSPVAEKGLERLVSRAVRAGKLRATLEPAEAVAGAVLSLVCVGTPSGRKGEANLDYVLRAADDIARALRYTRRYHTVAVRSTVPPGTLETCVIPRLERVARKRAGRDFGVCFHPESLREGSSIHDFFHPPKTVIGSYDARSARRLIELWRPIKAPVFVTSLRVAEMVKYADNAFHALKVAFANEIGALSKSLEIDSHEVMKIFVRDTKLNISPLYLKPGLAFGGPCLPKDLRALCAVARRARLEVPLLSSVLESNSRHLQRATQLVLATGRQKVGILGLVFKSDTDDLRESPACALVKSLLRAGKEVRVYDPRVRPERLIGANRDFVERELPQLSRLLAQSLQEVLASSEVIVVAGTHPEFPDGIRALKKRQILIDLVRLSPRSVPSVTRSVGLCW
ncbi:MAG: nucleotide sugar dehydrogenase [Acidobacteriia bacterium]|nr:nucleotide sugar dehydrogenase [Terriglobia bacterium]